MGDAGVQQLLLAGWRAAKYVAGYLATVAGVANTKTQPIEIVLVAQPGNDVLETVMTAVTAALFDFAGAWWQVQLVMYHQYLVTGDAVEVGQGRHCLTAQVHIGGRNQ